MPLLKFKNVTKTYDTNRKKCLIAVDKFSLTVSQGEMIILLGPSGCGKTTLLRMISGLETPSAGDIQMNDKSLGDIAPHKRPISMVFQNYALYPHMTAMQNLTYALRVKKKTKNEINRRLISCCDLLQLDGDILNQKPDALSGGQRQRVALGRALMQRPRVILLDEPFSSLDQNLRMHLRIQIRKIQQQLGLTMIMVTHDQGDALSMGDRVVLMNDGKMVQVATPQNLYHKPDNLFAATFMGWPPINLIKGWIQSEKNTLVFCQEDGGIKLPVGDHVLFEGQVVIIGIRPEQIQIRPQTGDNRSPYTCIDEEVAGAIRYIHIQCGDQKLTGIAVDNGIIPGNPVHFKISLKSVNFYDSKTGNRLRKRTDKPCF